MKRLIINFVGNKEELHKQLKIWSAEANKSMSGLVIDLIEKNKKKYEKTKTQIPQN